MHSLLSATKVIYYTNTLTKQDYIRNRKRDCGKDSYFYDCSVGGNICKDNKNDVIPKHQGDWTNLDDMEVQLFFIYEQYKQVKFVFDKAQYNNLRELEEKKFRVPLPKKLIITLNTDVGVCQSHRSYTEENENFPAYSFFPKQYRQIEKIKKRYIQDLYKERTSELEEIILKYYLICCAFGATIRSIERTLSHHSKIIFQEKISGWIANYPGKKTEYMEAMEELWRICKIFARVIDGKEQYDLLSHENSYYEFIDFIESQTLTKHFSIEKPKFDSLDSQTPRNEGIRLTVSVDDSEWFMSFMQKYRYICNPDYFLDFSWNMSSGESNLLSMFSSLYYVYESDFTNKNNGKYRLRNTFPEGDKKCDSILLMMDEADLSYHPEWQRQYINTLVAFLQKLYPSESFGSIQIILSTHSPILLGDMPKQNVYFLENKKGNTKLCTLDQLNTFGQNIHLLFREGFFLEQGTVGEFAYNKINYVMKELNDLGKILKEGHYHEDKKQSITMYMDKLSELQTYIDIIAEPIIKKRLMIQMERVRKLLYGDSGEQLLSNLSDEELEKRWEILNRERERRKYDTNPNIQRAFDGKKDI